MKILGLIAGYTLGVALSVASVWVALGWAIEQLDKFAPR